MPEGKQPQTLHLQLGQESCNICVTSKPETFHRSNVWLSHTTINTCERIEALSSSSFCRTKFTGFIYDTIAFKNSCNLFLSLFFRKLLHPSKRTKRRKQEKPRTPIMASCEAIDNGILLNQYIHELPLIYKGEGPHIIHFTTIVVSDIPISSSCEYKGFKSKIEKAH